MLSEQYKIFLITLTYIFAVIQVSDQSSCRPNGDPTRDQYIVAYGSLINTASKSKTYSDTGENIPANVSSFSRIWNCRDASNSLSTTYLGATISQNGSFNGVIFKLNNRSGIKEFDRRESTYCRREVNSSAISLLGNQFSNRTSPPQGQYWIYLTKKSQLSNPSKRYPIVQSYVDLFVAGCLEMEEKHKLTGYAKRCITSTSGWHYPWVNDRIFPRRPHVWQPKAGEIDGLLSKLIRKEFNSIVIE